MFDYRVYLNAFLADYRAGRFTNDSVAQVDRTLTRPSYRIIGIHHLTGDENRSKRNLFMDVVDATGNRLKEKIEWGWEGQKPGQHPNPVALDKPFNEPAGNISIDWGQKIWARVLGKDSDKVLGVTTQLPDDGPWNTLGHHSYYIAWVWNEGGVSPPDPPTPDEYERGLKDGYALAKSKAIEAVSKI